MFVGTLCFGGCLCHRRGVRPRGGVRRRGGESGQHPARARGGQGLRGLDFPIDWGSGCPGGWQGAQGGGAGGKLYQGGHGGRRERIERRIRVHRDLGEHDHQTANAY